MKQFYLAMSVPLFLMFICFMYPILFSYLCKRGLDLHLNLNSHVVFLYDLQKVDMMFAAFTGQPLEKVQLYTERDRFLSPSEVIISGLFFLLLIDEDPMQENPNLKSRKRTEISTFHHYWV